MILDRLENYELYRSLGHGIATALDYLRRTDFSQMADGRYEIDGDRVYAMVSRYQPKPLTAVSWEAHRQYIDVQYLALGAERMGYASLRDDSAAIGPYDPQKDFVLYDVRGDYFEVCQGSFAIFAPQDIHAPCLAVETPVQPSEVCKVVVKCRVQS